ncbi:MAG: glycosyltransferase family 4 protein [Chitinophagaceae bacterium]|nr:glycosyltransferase family 4 protein [Chitinophagaceae bacterium]
MTKPVVIGVDIRDLRIATTGTRTFLEELCRQFRQTDDPGARFVFFDTSIPVYTGRNKLLKLTEHLRYQLWKQCILPLKALLSGCDILFCTDYYVPLVRLGYHTIPMFHDAFFLEYPSHYNQVWLQLFKKLAVPAARRSPAVIVPSHYAKGRVQHFTGIDPQKLCVVYEAPKTLRRNNGPSHPVIRQMIEGKKNGLSYLLHVGSFDKRKNLGVLIEAFAQLVGNGYGHLRLVLAGKPSSKEFVDGSSGIHELIRRRGLEELVMLPGYIADPDLPWLYENALLYVFPSLNEGFGLPVLESFLMRVPVIAADNTCLPEIGGDAILGFDPTDPAALARSIQMLADNEPLRADMIRKGSLRLQLFSWEKAAAQLSSIFKDTASGVHS